MGKAEARVENALKDWCESVGGICRKIQWIGRKGGPDRLAFLPSGFHFLAEVKREKGGVFSKLQMREISRLRALGMRVYTVDSIEDIEAIASDYELHIARYNN